MSSLLVILIGTVLVNTFLLMHNDAALGGDRSSGSIAIAIRVAIATLVTEILAVMLALVVINLLPNVPADTVLFIFSFAVITIVIGLHRLTRRRLPRLRRSLASSPILVVSNCLALGAILLNPMSTVRAPIALLYSSALGIVFVATLVAFVTLASRIAEREVPAAFRLAPITLVSAGLVTLALMGFTGLIRA